jgi:hypothetical protein
MISPTAFETHALKQSSKNGALQTLDLAPLLLSSSIGQQIDRRRLTLVHQSSRAQHRCCTIVEQKPPFGWPIPAGFTLTRFQS